MGYRYPDKYKEEEEARKHLRVGVAFEDHFEDGPNGEIFFYRGGIGRPVRVSGNERTDACERWDRYSKRADLWYLCTIGVGAAVLLFHFDLDGPGSGLYVPACLLAALAGHALIRRLLCDHVTRHFRDRFPAGPGRTRWAYYSAKAASVGWGSLIFAMVALLFLVGTRVIFDPVDPTHRGMALLELALGSGIFLIAAVKMKNWLSSR